MKLSNIPAALLASLLLVSLAPRAEADDSRGGRIVDRSLASLKGADSAPGEPRWHQDAKTFENLANKPDVARVRAETDAQLAQSFQRSPYLNYNR